MSIQIVCKYNDWSYNISYLILLYNIETTEKKTVEERKEKNQIIQVLSEHLNSLLNNKLFNLNISEDEFSDGFIAIRGSNYMILDSMTNASENFNTIVELNDQSFIIPKNSFSFLGDIHNFIDYINLNHLCIPIRCVFVIYSQYLII